MNRGLNFQECPAETPVIIGDSNQCSSCPKETPIYNLNDKKCITCSGTLVFSPEERKCVQTCCGKGHYFNFALQ